MNDREIEPRHFNAVRLHLPMYVCFKGWNKEDDHVNYWNMHSRFWSIVWMIYLLGLLWEQLMNHAVVIINSYPLYQTALSDLKPSQYWLYSIEIQHSFCFYSSTAPVIINVNLTAFWLDLSLISCFSALDVGGLMFLHRWLFMS